MKNVTISLDEETARWARVNAAKKNISLSRYVGELLYEHMHHSREYEAAMQRYLSRGPFKQLTGPPQRYATREELHERSHSRSK